MTYNLIARLELENLYQPGNAAHFTLHDFTLLAISQSTLGIFCSANKSRGTILIECCYTRSLLLFVMHCYLHIRDVRKLVMMCIISFSCFICIRVGNNFIVRVNIMLI